MKDTVDTNNLDIEGLFERYQQSPESRVFVPLADACRKVDRVEEALEICEAGIGRNPGYASGHVVRGKCLYDLGRLDDAKEAFETVLTIDGDNLVALKFLGMMEAVAGRFDAAGHHLKHILRLDPENPEILEALQHVDEQMRATSDEGNQATEDNEQDPDRTDFTDEHSSDDQEDNETSDELATTTLADIYASQGYRDKALKIYRELLAKQPNNQAIKEKISVLSREPVESDVVDVDDTDMTDQIDHAQVELADEGSAKPDASEPESVEPEDEAPRVIELGVDRAEVAQLESAPSDDNEEHFEEMRPPQRASAGRVEKSSRQKASAKRRATKKRHRAMDKASDKQFDEAKSMDHFKHWVAGLRK